VSDVNKISVSDSSYEQRVEGWLEDLSDVEDSDTDPNYAIQSDLSKNVPLIKKRKNQLVMNPTQIRRLHQTTKLQSPRVKEKSLHLGEMRI
jgi:hypothetical protein